MKLFVWLLLALLALCSATLQDTQSLQTTEDQEDTAEIYPNRSELMKNRSRRPSVRYQGSTLTWEYSYGSVLSGAYSTYISYTGRHDYVCKYGCSSGFFSPAFGSYCYYPLGGREHRGYPFQLLVNKDNFEILEWEGGSWGSVPQNSVQTCSGGDLYVGKNKYGLGKVHTIHQAFFLPWRGREYWYKSYDVLTVKKNYNIEEMYNVNYNLDVTVTENPPEVIRQSNITNNECRPVEKTVELSETYQEEKRWDMTTSFSFLRSITASVPVLQSSGITLSFETTEQFSRGTTVVKSKTYSVSVQQTIPPNHSCTIKMMGHKYRAAIPYTANVRRTYHNGQTRVRSITGTFTGANMGGIHSVVERCRPVPNPSPCT